MADPITGKLALQHLQQADQLKSAQPDTPKPAPGQSSFSEVMAQKQQTQKADAVPAVEQAQPSEAAQRLDSFVEGVLNDEKKIDRLMTRNAKGAALDQGELIQLQGLIYGYAQKVDLASKVVDKSTGGLKQIMNTQV